MLILDLLGIGFHAVVVFGLGKDLLFKSVLGPCECDVPAIVRSCLLVHHSQHWERYPLEDLKIGYLPETVMAH
jgi:hypothetical protein